MFITHVPARIRVVNYRREISKLKLKFDVIQGPVATEFSNLQSVTAIPDCKQLAIKSKRACKAYDASLVGIVYISR